MKSAAATLIAVLSLAFALAISADAAPKGNQANCPNGPPAWKPQRSYSGNTNACGPKKATSTIEMSISLV